MNEPKLQQKHRQLQEQLSSHILKRRVSGDQRLTSDPRVTTDQQQRRQQQPQVKPPTQGQEQMRLLDEHFTQQQMIQQNIQVIFRIFYNLLSCICEEDD